MAPTDPLRDESCHLSTRFEDWCERAGTHPEAFGAWERYEAQLPSHAPATSGVA